MKSQKLWAKSLIFVATWIALACVQPFGLTIDMEDPVV
jgi:hypothetical protein